MWNVKNLGWITLPIVYVTYMILIAFAMYITQSAMPLWALIFLPSLTIEDSNEEDVDEMDLGDDEDEEMEEDEVIEFAKWYSQIRFDSSGKYLNKTDDELMEMFKNRK